jgi:hypothetical protein
LSKWLKGAIKSGRKFPSYVDKPCHLLGWCPYGPLVEEFPLYDAEKEYCISKGWFTPDGFPDLNRTAMDKDFIVPEYQCGVFGHDCPVYYLAEAMCEEVEESEDDDPDDDDFEDLDKSEEDE